MYVGEKEGDLPEAVAICLLGSAFEYATEVIIMSTIAIFCPKVTNHTFQISNDDGAT
jgi:hypothetical protein